MLARDMTISKPVSVSNAPASTIGGFSSWKAFDQRPYRRTGTKRGWAEAPPLSKIASSFSDEDDDLYTIEDIVYDSTSSLDETFLSDTIFMQERGAYNE